MYCERLITSILITGDDVCVIDVCCVYFVLEFAVRTDDMQYEWWLEWHVSYLVPFSICLLLLSPSGLLWRCVKSLGLYAG